MDADKNMSSLENSRSGLTETDGNSSSGEKHKTNCVGNNVVQPDDVEMLINGISSDPSNPDQQLIVTPEMLYKLSKKIAQLTKVRYQLIFRNKKCLIFMLKNFGRQRFHVYFKGYLFIEYPQR